MVSTSTLLFGLELTGTFVFGLNGALVAMEAEQPDLVGVVVLGTMTALGGGIVRDILIGASPDGETDESCRQGDHGARRPSL